MDSTPAGFVYQLRALRVWAGNPGHSEIGRRAGRRLASSTMYDALRPSRATLPPLETVQAIVHGCLPDQASAAEWVTAWRAIALREFERANRLPAGSPPALRIVGGAIEGRGGPLADQISGTAPQAIMASGMKVISGVIEAEDA